MNPIKGLINFKKFSLLSLTEQQTDVAEWLFAIHVLKTAEKAFEGFKENGFEIDVPKWEHPSIETLNEILSIDFKGTSLIDFISFNYLNRFNDVSPYDFEDFICFLVSAKGHLDATVTRSSSDYGVDILCDTRVEGEEKEVLKTAIQVKRYAESNSVGVKDLNQLLGGKEYYSCQKAIIVTTSNLTKNARELAIKTNTEVWTWDQIDEFIQHYILLDFPYHSFSNSQEDYSYDDLEVAFSSIEQDVFLSSKESAVRINFKLANVGEKSINITGISTATCLIKRNGFQINKISLDSDSFTNGIIYPKGFAELGIFILKEKAGIIAKGDRFILELLGSNRDYLFELEITANDIGTYSTSLSLNDSSVSDAPMGNLTLIVLIVITLFFLLTAIF